MHIKYSYVYIVLREFTVLFATEDKEEAKNFVQEMNIKERRDILNEWGNDDPDIDDYLLALFQLGYDNSSCSIYRVNIAAKKKCEEIEIAGEGISVLVSDIRHAMNNYSKLYDDEVFVCDE